MQGSLKGFQLKTGSVDGQVHVMGGLGKLAVGGWFCAGSNIEVEGLLKSAKIVSLRDGQRRRRLRHLRSQLGQADNRHVEASPANVPFFQGDFWVDRITI